jgi:2-polyprenyl-6-methoxyphenol hydroxylase-like FAD-dependent oxidoreductase
MKIIVIGAGISGLGTAISLRKYLQPQLGSDLEVKVYDEARVKPAGEIEYSWHDHSDIRSKKKKNQGAAISLQANAFKVLRDLDPQLAERVYASGLPCRGFTWKSASDWVLGHEDLDAHLISRPALIECLMGALPEGIVQYRTVDNVSVDEGKKPTIRFADGGEETADLIVGADGIRSPLRKALFGEAEEYRPKYLSVSASCPSVTLSDNHPQRQLRRRRRPRSRRSSATRLS